MINMYKIYMELSKLITDTGTDILEDLYHSLS